MKPARRNLIDARRAAAEGRRYYEFYQGYRARRMSRPGNPHKAGTPEHEWWEAGWKYACDEETPPPVVRLGPGGDFVRDLSERDL